MEIIITAFFFKKDKREVNKTKNLLFLDLKVDNKMNNKTKI